MVLPPPQMIFFWETFPKGNVQKMEKSYDPPPLFPKVIFFLHFWGPLDEGKIGNFFNFNKPLPIGISNEAKTGTLFLSAVIQISPDFKPVLTKQWGTSHGSCMSDLEMTVELTHGYHGYATWNIKFMQI